jgi:nanoRNase/pAp phosphatase (c-di-AMP/oligoRNAs hydrolase)
MTDEHQALTFHEVPTLEVGDIVQVNPDKDVFGACMVTVSEIKAWGIQGYVQNAGQEGQAYIRLKFGDFEHTGGKAVWMAQ